MRLRRRKEPVLQPEHARLVTEVMTATRGAIRMHEALPVQRDELLAQARRGALACRRFLVLGQRLPGEIDAQPALFPALRALERATCSLVGTRSRRPTRWARCGRASSAR
jgi:hypothetical protein